MSDRTPLSEYTDAELRHELHQRVTQALGGVSAVVEWPPVAPASAYPEGSLRRGTTGQLFKAVKGRWVYIL